jgi:hypothetical protein
VHKGNAICRAVGGIIFSRAAAVAESNDLLPPARTFPTVSGLRDRAASEIDKAAHPEIQKLRVYMAWMPRHPCNTDSPALMCGMLFLGA